MKNKEEKMSVIIFTERLPESFIEPVLSPASKKKVVMFHSRKISREEFQRLYGWAAR